MADTAGNKIDIIEQKLRSHRERLIVVWRSIEHSRHGVIPLDKDTYIDRKIEHGNLMYDIGKLDRDLNHSVRAYYNELMPWQNEIQRPARVTLRQLWQLWHGVLAARRAVADMPARPAREYRLTFPHAARELLSPGSSNISLFTTRAT